MATNISSETRTTERPLIEKAAFLVGTTFLLVGILGFIPGVTQHFNTIEFAGHQSGAKLLGLFQVSILHNIVHLLFGVAGLAAAKTFSASRSYLLGGGLIYGALGIYGIVIDKMSDVNFVPVNTADNWLHVGLAAGMIALGMMLATRPAASTVTQ